jgi:glycine/D-amino acid oxidase-like deaminating enzyme
MKSDAGTAWEADAPPYCANPPLHGHQRADVVIVGGGFSGLSTAWHLKRAAPGTAVTLIEAREIGAGASGRAAGNCFTLFGENVASVRTWYGAQKTKDAHRYLRTALDYVAQLIAQYRMESDYQPAEFLRVATSDRLVRRLTATHRIYRELDIDDDFEWRTTDDLRQRFPSSPFRAGLAEKRCGLLNPLKHVREWKRLCEQEGVDIFESTPLSGLERSRSRSLSILTPQGSISCERVMLATNAYSRRLPNFAGLRGKQSPVWTHMIATAPLTPALRQAIGWRDGEGVYDCLKRLHYFRLSAKGRVYFGGGAPAVTTAAELDDRSSAGIWSRLAVDLVRYFPPLAEVPIEYRWKGPISVCADLVPTIGFLGDARVLFSGGFAGHGIPIAQLNGKTATDLLLGRSSELTAFWAVNRRVLPWPATPLDHWLKRGTLAAMRLSDAWAQAR